MPESLEDLNEAYYSWEHPENGRMERFDNSFLTFFKKILGTAARRRTRKIALRYFTWYFIAFTLGICIKNVPQCAECLDHRTCQRCQKGFLLLESYWGALCVSSCPDGFTAIQTEENGLVCKNSNGMRLL